ncbi:hypothetical protein T4D_2593, partial [Trichinella pseudospiralis]
MRRSSDNTSIFAMLAQGETHSFQLGINDLDTSACVKGKFFCEGCVFGSMAQTPHKEIIERRQSVPAEILYADVCRPFIYQSVGGSCHFICFKDESSGYQKVTSYNTSRLLWLKSCKKLDVTCNGFEHTVGLNLSTKNLIKSRIVHEKSSPYTFQCNAVVAKVVDSTSLGSMGLSM